MAHQVLNLIGYAYLFVGGAGFLIFLTLEVADRLTKKWKQRQGSELDYARYAASRDIRDIRRRAIHDLLTVERQYRDMGTDDDVIEGTATVIEVGR